MRIGTENAFTLSEGGGRGYGVIPEHGGSGRRKWAVDVARGGRGWGGSYRGDGGGCDYHLQRLGRFEVHVALGESHDDACL